MPKDFIDAINKSEQKNLSADCRSKNGVEKYNS